MLSLKKSEIMPLGSVYVPFSVCLSIYENDNIDCFLIAFDSIWNQTIMPAEVILVVDGPVSNVVENAIYRFQKTYSSLRVVWLSENKGLGNALRIAVETASNEIIARMDSDDISLPNRFEAQLKCFEEDPHLSIVGGAISEFINTPNNIVAKRICPLEDRDIKRYMKSRCGFNHMTVMFRKSEVLKVGNYQDWFWNEDYYLWLRMLQGGCRFRNLADVLVNVRVGKDMYARRGGWCYFKSEYRLQLYMLSHKMINYFQFLYNVLIRFIIQVLMPNCIRAVVFKKILRHK